MASLSYEAAAQNVQASTGGNATSVNATGNAIGGVSPAFNSGPAAMVNIVNLGLLPNATQNITTSGMQTNQNLTTSYNHLDKVLSVDLDEPNSSSRSSAISR
jgi:hypothetical protein